MKIEDGSIINGKQTHPELLKISGSLMTSAFTNHSQFTARSLALSGPATPAACTCNARAPFIKASCFQRWNTTFWSHDPSRFRPIICLGMEPFVVHLFLTAKSCNLWISNQHDWSIACVHYPSNWWFWGAVLIILDWDLSVGLQNIVR